MPGLGEQLVVGLAFAGKVEAVAILPGGDYDLEFASEVKDRASGAICQAGDAHKVPVARFLEGSAGNSSTRCFVSCGSPRWPVTPMRVFGASAPQ